MSVTLLAVAPGGEAYWFRDDYGAVYRDDRYSPGPPVLTSARATDLAITEQGAERLDEAFSSWTALAARVSELVPCVGIDPDQIPVTLEFARKAPRLLAGWLRDDRAPLIPAVVSRLLVHPQVSRDAGLVVELAQLQRRAQPSLPVMKQTVLPRRQSTFLEFFSDAA